MNLYELSTEVMAALDQGFDPETGAALPALEESRALWANKSQHVVAYTLNLEAQAAMIREAAKKMDARAKSAERRAEWLREYLLDNMRMIGANGRLYLAGTEADVRNARDAAERALRDAGATG